MCILHMHVVGVGEVAMGFLAEEILQEFTEAAEMGQKSLLRWARAVHDARWWNEEGFKARRPVYVIALDTRYRALPKARGGSLGRQRNHVGIWKLVKGDPRPPQKERSPSSSLRTKMDAIKPLAVQRMMCPLCSGPLEKREGMSRLIHVEIPTHPISVYCSPKEARRLLDGVDCG